MKSEDANFCDCGFLPHILAEQDALPECVCLQVALESIDFWREDMISDTQDPRFILLGDGRMVNCKYRELPDWPYAVVSGGVYQGDLVCVLRQSIEERSVDDRLERQLRQLPTWEDIEELLHEFIWDRTDDIYGNDDDPWEWKHENGFPLRGKALAAAQEADDVPTEALENGYELFGEEIESLARVFLPVYGFPATLDTAKFVTENAFREAGYSVDTNTPPTRGIVVTTLVVAANLPYTLSWIKGDAITCCTFSSIWAGDTLERLPQMIRRHTAWARRIVPDHIPNTSLQNNGRPKVDDDLTRDITSHLAELLELNAVYERHFERLKQQSGEKTLHPLQKDRVKQMIRTRIRRQKNKAH